MLELKMRELKLTDVSVKLERMRIFLPDCGLFDAKIDGNGSGEAGTGVCGVRLGTGVACSTGAAKRWICRIYESARQWRRIERRPSQLGIGSPFGKGFHVISRLPMPALSSCTFSGSPGQAVSKHHKSLQQT